MMPKTEFAETVTSTSALVAADLFCGAGGLSFGFQQAGFHIAFANDINEEYANTYRLNHDGTAFFCESIEDLKDRQRIQSKPDFAKQTLTS